MNALQKSLARAAREWAKVDKSAIGFVAPYQAAHPKVEPVPEANIATDLGPRLDDVLHRGSRFSVVGYDGAALAKPGYIWISKLKKWLDDGCDVDYFLSCPSAKAVKALQKMTKHLADDAGEFRLFQPKKRQSASFKFELAELESFHFAFSENPLTLWIETNHPPTSNPKAYNCFFFPEEAAAETGLGETYRRRFQRLIAGASKEVSLAKAK